MTSVERYFWTLYNLTADQLKEDIFNKINLQTG